MAEPRRIDLSPAARALYASQGTLVIDRILHRVLLELRDPGRARFFREIDAMNEAASRQIEAEDQRPADPDVMN